MGALAFVVDEGLDASPHLVGVVVVGEEALYPPPVSLPGAFEAPARVGFGSAVQRTVPQPEGCVMSSDQSLFFTRHPRFMVRKTLNVFSH